FADLHPHLMVLPFTLLAIGLSLALVLGAQGGEGRKGYSWLSKAALGEWALLLAAGVTVGALRVINTWDFPSYLILAVGAAFLAAFFRRGGLSVGLLGEVVVKAAFVYAVGYVALLPFHMTNETFFSSVEATTNRTVLWQFLAIFGLPVFILGSFFLYEARDWLAAAWRWTWSVVSGNGDREVYGRPGMPVGGMLGERGNVAVGMVSAMRVGVLVLVLAGLGYVLAVFASAPLGSTIPFLAMLLLVVFAVGARWAFSSRPDAPVLAFLALSVGLAFALGLGLDLYRVEGDIDRMNSVFKIYLQIWVLLSLGAAYALWRLAGVVPWRRLPRMGPAGWAWTSVLILLFASAGIYTIVGTASRLKDRFDGNVTLLTLDGMAYMEHAVFSDEKGAVALMEDYDGILWLQRNVEGSPVILEAHTPTYRWGNRIANYTGLPSVIGWEWHQQQQRWDYQPQIAQRISEVNRFFSTGDISASLEIVRKYNVQYVYIGTLEKLYYPVEGIDKFQRMGPYLDEVYKDRHATIYKVRPEVLGVVAR
ncbi:MAG: hypothetical protein FJ317_01320, partial [SAR202 cluster bacterium]|nr:hypothetical protein [SAR202 cluster bacterium]